VKRKDFTISSLDIFLLRLSSIFDPSSILNKPTSLLKKYAFFKFETLQISRFGNLSGNCIFSSILKKISALFLDGFKKDTLKGNSTTKL
tara:strand:+ start:643 stop:909 length:267 start_codon:yes stop_codon:yes gene_type:complete